MMSDKLNKILVVIFLTLLIWAWTFLAVEKTFSRPGLLEASSTDPGLLVLFSLDGGKSYQTQIPLTSLGFKGTPSKISSLRKRYSLPSGHQDKEKLDFYYNPVEYSQTPGDYKRDILDILKDNDKIHDLALTLESCSPSEVTIKVERLIKKELHVECVDKDGRPLTTANPDPSIVEIYVREGYVYEFATAELSPQLMDLALKEPVEVTPFVKLGLAGQVRKAADPVKVTLKSEERLGLKNFQTTMPIGIVMSQELQDKYKVTVDASKIPKTIGILATEEAFKAYGQVAHPFQIEITENDVKDLSLALSKRITYNFPPEYIRKGEIKEDPEKLPVSVEVKIELRNPGI